jgi:Uma2 family endonuclease
LSPLPQILRSEIEKMATTASLLTAEEYLSLSDQGVHTELVRGELVMMNMPGLLHGLVCANIAAILRAYARRRKLGRVFTNDVSIITEPGPDTVRGADVSFYSYARVPKGAVTKGYASAAPDVVFEVRSPTERWPDLLKKTGEYLAAGVDAVCLVGCDAHRVTIYRSEGAAAVFEEGAILLLPEVDATFQVNVAKLFDDS